MMLTISDLEQERAKLDALIGSLKSYEEAGGLLPVGGLVMVQVGQAPPPPVRPAPAAPAPEPKKKLTPTPAPVTPVTTAKPLPPADQDKDNNSKWTACSEQAVALGRKVLEPFTATDLGARLDATERTLPISRAYNWLAAWKAKGWITTVGPGQYRRAAEFGT